MSVRKGIVLIVTLATLSLLIACGSSSPTPNPVGATKNSLNGTYVFSSTGIDANGDFLTMAGTLAANGSGSITGGTMDLIGLEITTPTPVAQPITGGSYTIGADGRGQITINTTTIGSNGNSEGVNFTLDFVLMSASHGLITEYDSQGTGSGTIDLQSAVTQSQLTASYAFGISGQGTSGLPYSAVGAVTLASTGAATTGIEDINNDGTPSTVSLTTTSAVNLTTTPGTAIIANSGGASYTFDVYPIDNTHFKLIETDGVLLLSGDAYTSGTSLPTGAVAYTMEGYDSSSDPIGEGGWLDIGSTGAITAGIEDFNDAGAVPTTPFTPGGSFSALASGRAELSFSAFVNGAASDVPGAYLFAAYPFTYTGGSGVQLLEIDGGGVTSGALYPQSSTSLAAANYGFNLSAINFGDVSQGGGLYEEDDIAQFLTTSSGFSGAVDINDAPPSTLTFDKSLTGSFTNTPAVDANGRGVATTNYFSFYFYAVDASTFLVMETDSTQTGTGTFQSQSAISAGSAARPLPTLLRPVTHSHGALKKKQIAN
jgi:hypothetical protein